MNRREFVKHVFVFVTFWQEIISILVCLLSHHKQITAELPWTQTEKLQHFLILWPGLEGSDFTLEQVNRANTPGLILTELRRLDKTAPVTLSSEWPSMLWACHRLLRFTWTKTLNLRFPLICHHVRTCELWALKNFEVQSCELVYRDTKNITQFEGSIRLSFSYAPFYCHRHLPWFISPRSGLQHQT